MFDLCLIFDMFCIFLLCPAKKYDIVPLPSVKGGFDSSHPVKGENEVEKTEMKKGRIPWFTVGLILALALAAVASLPFLFGPLA